MQQALKQRYSKVDTPTWNGQSIVNLHQKRHKMKRSHKGSEELTLEVQGLALLACALLASAESAKVFSSLWHHLHVNFAHVGQVWLPRHSGDSAAHSQLARVLGMASDTPVCPAPHLAKKTHSDATSWLSVNLNVEEDLQTKYVRRQLLRVAPCQARETCLGS